MKNFRKEVFALRSATGDWKKAKISDKETDEIVKHRNQRSDAYTFDKPKQSLICKVLGDPRTIDTSKGPWEVLDIEDQKGEQYILSLGHTVLNKAIRAKMTQLSSLVGQVLVITYLGKVTGKSGNAYNDYIVQTFEEFKAATS
jgi:hypothetical protein